MAINKLTLIALQETRLSAEVDVMDTEIPGYTLFRKDLSRTQGGVAIYAAAGLQPTEEGAERLRLPRNCQVISLRPSSAPPIWIINCYRSPNQKKEQREMWINDLIRSIGELGLDCPAMLLGDLNLSPEKRGEEGLHQALLTMGFTDTNVDQMPTHRTRRIDHALIRNLECSQFSIAAPLENGNGHGLLLLDIQARGHSGNCWEVRGGGRQWSKADWPLARTLAAFTSPDRTTQSPLHMRLGLDQTSLDPTDITAKVTAALLDIVEVAVPRSKQVRVRPWAPAWISHSVITHSSIVQQKKRELKEAKETGDANKISAAHVAFQRARSRRGGNLRSVRRAHFESVAEKARKENKPWDAIHSLGGRRKGVPPLPPLHPDGEWAILPLDKATTIASSFSNNFSPPSNVDLPEKPPPTECEEEYLLTCEGAVEILSHLPRSKSPGPDTLAPVLLKELARQIAPSITILINRVMAIMTVPEQWKTGICVPFGKKENPTKAQDFRPITLLDALTRVFEAHLGLLLQPYLEASLRQFAFQQGSGCSDAHMRLLLDIIEIHSEAGSGPLKVAAVLLDARKAYDSIPTGTILAALRSRQVPARLLHLVHSWIGGRSLQVRVGSAIAPPINVDSGVSQGSLLGPALFSIAIDPVLNLDLPPGTRMSLYADDIIIIANAGTASQWSTLQQTVQRVELYLAKFIGLQVNPEKSEWIMFQSHTKGPGNRRLHSMGGNTIPYNNTPKYLGVVYDEALAFNAHWSRTSGQMKGIATAVVKNCRGNKHLQKIALKSFLEGRLHFALPFTPPRSSSVFRQITSAQVYAARLYLNEFTKKKNEDGSPSYAYVFNGKTVLQRAGLAHPEELANRQALRFMYSCLKGNRRYGTWVSPDPGRVDGPRTRAITTRSGGDEPTRVIVPSTRLQTLHNLAPIATPSAWNSLAWPEAVNDRVNCLASLDVFTAAIPTLSQPL